MPARQRVPDTLCTCDDCVAENPGGLVIPRQEWVMHSALTHSRASEKSQQDSTSQAESLSELVFRLTLNDGADTHVPLRPPSSTNPINPPYLDLVQSARDLLSRPVELSSSFLFPPQATGIRPTLEDNHSPSSIHGAPQLQTPQPQPAARDLLDRQFIPPSSTISQATAPASSPSLKSASMHVTNKNLTILANIHLRVKNALANLRTQTETHSPQETAPEFLTDAESLLEEIETDLAQVRLKAPTVTSRKKQVMDDISLLQSSIAEWRTIYPDLGPVEYDTDYVFSSRRICTTYPAVQVGMFVGITSRIIFGMSRIGCDVLLKSIHLIGKLLLGQPLNDKVNPRLAMLPSTIETVEKQFNIDARTTVFAVCPTCHLNHDPQPSESETYRFPKLCDYKQARDSISCGTTLLDEDGKPLRRFEYNHLNDYIASLLSRPEIEQHIDEFCARTAESCSKPPAETLSDVSDGHFWRNFEGPDGRPFVDGKDEARIALALNIDYFNPEGGSIRGATKSCGLISAACLNLPPEIRYDTANMYVAGIIPGPHEPTGDGETHYVRRVVDDLETAFTRGIRYSRTACCSCGRVARVAVAIVVADFPAGRRITGQTSVTSHHLCTVCECQHKTNMYRTDYQSWKLRDRKAIFELHKNYHLQPTEKKQESFAKKWGVRASELWRLPYWNPIRQLAIDPMHSLFLVLCQRYTREALRIRKIDPKDDKKELDQLDAKLKKKGAFYYNFRSPFIVFEDDDDDEIPLVQDIIEAPEPSAYGEEVIDSLMRDPAVGWRNAVPTIHNILLEPIEETSVDAAFNSLKTRLCTKSRPRNALLYVCADLNQLTDEDPKDITKEDLAEKLVKWRRTMPFQRTHIPHINSDGALERLQHVIQNIVTPSSIGSLPSNWGEKRAGTMKADQWRTVWRLHMPLALVSLWGTGSPKRMKDADSMLPVLENAMSLSAATTLATGRSITVQQAELYRQALKAHVDGLLVLFPGFLLPTHHLAFHLFDFMLLFGPVKSWWCFPFERLIGRIQRIPHNHLVGGELEATMLHSFVQGSKIRQWLSLGDAPEAIQECNKVLQQATGSKEATADKFLLKECPKDLQSLVGMSSVLQVQQFYRYGVSYSNHRFHEGNSLVLIRSQRHEEPTPARIEHILKNKGVDQVVVRLLKPAPFGVPNPFRPFPHFHASIYSNEFSTEMMKFDFDTVVGHFAMYALDREINAVVFLLR